MNQEITSIITGLLISFFVSVLAYAHYKTSTLDIRHKYCTFWPRFFSPSIDSVILFPLVNGSYLLLLCFELPSVLVFMLAFVMCTTGHIYNIYFHGKYGQTVGKMACKVKVVRATTEEQISFTRAFLRDSIPLFLSIIFLAFHRELILASPEETTEFFLNNIWMFLIPMLWFWAEVITMLTNKKRRAIHDFIAGTVVIRTNIREEVCEDQAAEVQAA